MSTNMPDWQCTWHTGPDAGARHPLPPGRHLVGRAPSADVRCDDPALQPHHAVLEVAADGGVWVTQLTGRVPVRVDGRPIDAAVALAEGDRLEIGGSLLVLERHTAPPSAAAVHAGALVRGPRSIARWEPAELTPPAAPVSSPETVGGLVPALLGLAGATAIAVVMRQPMFLVFGALGAVVALGSWAAQRLATRRRRQRELHAAAAERAVFDAALSADRVDFLRWHRASVPTVATARQVLTERTTELWTRRTDHPDAATVSLGLGDQVWRLSPTPRPHLPAEPMVEPELPVPASLAAGARLAVQGPQAVAVARAVVAQLAASCGPADLRVVVVTDRPARWDCLRRLPHAQLPDGTTAVLDEAALTEALEQFDLGSTPSATRTILVVSDAAEALGTRTSPLRRAVNHERTALLAVLPDHDTVPHVCTAVLSTGHGPISRWVADTTTTLLPVPVRVTGLGEQAMFRCAAAVAELRDPEDPLATNGRLPRDVALADLSTIDVDTVVARWTAHTDPPPRTPIGLAADGVVDIDLERDGPHALIAGTTGSGKSELLRSLVVGMAAHASPQHLTFVLVDYKGGAAFDCCRELPHVVGMVTDLDDQLADRALRSLHAELRRREALLRDHRAADLRALRVLAPDVVLPRLVVVIDEFAALVAEQPDFLHSLVGVAQRGRSLGVHLILATQRPQGVISDDIRANTNLRIALRLHDVADATDVVGDRSPAQLPRSAPGRAVMRLGADEHVTFQTARADAAMPSVIATAARTLTAPAPPAPWLPPLPESMSRGDLPAGAIGLADDPDLQRQVPLSWSTEDGSVIVLGSAGSGVSSTLHTLAVHALADHGTHVYVLLGHHDDRLSALDSHPRCAVVSVHERERTLRLVHRLRGAQPGRVPRRVLVVDGLDVVRRALDDVDTLPVLDALDEILTLGDANGPVLLVGVDRAAAVPAAVVARCPARWVMHLHDPLEGAVFGVSARQVPPPIPGRLFVAGLGLVAQVAAPGSVPLYDVTTDDRMPAIEATPARVEGSRLPGAHHLDSTSFLPVGLAVADGEPAVIEVPDGEHLLVLGGARTGRSTALGRLTECWRAAHPFGRVVAVLPRRSAFPPTLADDVVTTLDAPPRGDGEVLVVVDDAELVDDPSGALAALAAGGRGDRMVIAAGRPDALRQTYGHWTTVLRRSRLGLVAVGGSDLDGDLLAATLPRRLPVPARQGLMWVVAHGAPALVQVALPTTPASDAPRRATRRAAK